VTKSVGVCLKLLFPSKSHVTLFGLSQPDLNRYVDMILTIVYNQVDNRPVIFLGSNMDLCTAVNWKQPNFSVFYQVQKSVKKAIKFAKTENLLGVVCNLNIFVNEANLDASANFG
jgi:CDK inhibitor PHO81